MGRHVSVADPVPGLRVGVRPLAALVQGLLGGAAMMRATKLAIAAALAADEAIANLDPPVQIFSVERATVPVLPAIEIISVSSDANQHRADDAA